jgi:WD40 repeat protein
MAQEHKRTRRWWTFAVVIFAGSMFWCGGTLYQRLTCPWQIVRNIKGFVSYGWHETIFSPDDTQIAITHSGSSKILDWIHGSTISTLEHYYGQGIANFSSDGRLISHFPEAQAAVRKALVWSVTGGRLLGRVELPESVKIEWCLPSFTLDNKKIVGLYEDGLIIWDSSTLKHIGRIKLKTFIRDKRFSRFIPSHPISHEMAFLDADGKLLIIDLQKQTATPLLARQFCAVKSANWSPDGKQLVVVGLEDGAVAIWDVPSGTVVANLPETKAVWACFSRDGQKIVTTGERSDVIRERGAPPVWDRWTRIWDAESGKLIRELPTTSIVTFSPNWQYWVDAGPNGIQIASFDGSEVSVYPYLFDGHGSICVFSRDNDYLAYVNCSGRVVVFRHNYPIRFWIECVTFSEFWTTVLAAVGLLYSIRKRNFGQE